MGARVIPAGFKLALTGTPIENNLGNLWSIFNILNPGLLGTQLDFRQRYAGTAAECDPDAVKIVKRLIKPFILRRLKKNTLTALPPITRQTITITPTEEKAALYDVLRRNALQRLTEQKDAYAADGLRHTPKSQRLSILRELSRLRLACCHAPLIGKEVEGLVAKSSIALSLFKKSSAAVIRCWFSVNLSNILQ